MDGEAGRSLDLGRLGPWRQSAYVSPQGALYIHDNHDGDDTHEPKRRCVLLLPEQAAMLAAFLTGAATASAGAGMRADDI